MSSLDRSIHILMLCCACIIVFIYSNSYAKETNINLNEWERSPLEVEVKNTKKTWDSIARYTGTPASILKRYNKIKSLKIGDKVQIPARTIYQIKNGETAIGVAVKFGMTFSELIALNNLKPPFELKDGKKTKVIEVLASVPIKKPLKVKKPVLIWPIKGEVTSNFGVEKNGTLNDGIRISVTKNTKVRAAKSGTVVYIGNEIGRYGNIIIIQHKGEWISSYGGLSLIDVTKGDVIKMGQKIGEIKDSNLYFSLRDGSTPVNPIKYFKKPKDKKKA
jgi:murein DD-endopeptidase MepM/ murein hydrolase activator NlpD